MDQRECHEFVDARPCLQARLNINTEYGDNDLATWLVDNVGIREGDRVLDVGCGDGTHLRLIAAKVARGNHCLGIDRDPEMVNAARAKSEGFLPSVTFHEMDMDNVGPPIDDASLDHIYSVYAFYYSQHAPETLDALRKKLRPGGRISIVGPRRGNNKEWFDFLEQFMELPASINVCNTVFMESLVAYGQENANRVDVQEFVNNISMPRAVLRDYWTANIYHEPRFDASFELYAGRHFAGNDVFTYCKRAQMITMEF